VRVQTGVLMKVHNALRPAGQLLIQLPKQADMRIVVHARGLHHEEPFHELRLREIVRGCNAAVDTVVQWGLFELATQGSGSHCDEFESVTAWADSEEPFCADLEELAAIQARLSALVGRRRHKVKEYWQEDGFLLRKRV